MEVVPAMSDSSPFQRRDVTEWSHMDRLTGMMETARVETDRWAASTPTSAHSYGKVVDSRNRSLPDGSAQQRQRQQLEVFQTKGPGGSLQVIRTQSVTSSNSSWRGTSSSRVPLPAITQDFGNLQLTLNPLDLSSEKSKGSVGRSGSIGGRRPPSRPRSLVSKLVTPLAIEEDDVNSRLAQVSRICQQVHDDANERAVKNVASLRELTSSTSSRSASESYTNGHLSISRKKSSSIEDLHNGEDVEDVDEGFKRSSKVRRSLQFPLKKLEARGGVSKLLQDLEDSNKRNAAEGRVARKSFEALENVLKRGNNKFDSSNKDSEDSESSHAGYEENGDVNNKHIVNNINLDSFSKKFNRFSLDKRQSFIDASDSKDELESSNDESKTKSPATKRHSFVTVESLKEVRGRLKRLNSPLDGIDTESGMDETEDNDDGIGTDESTKRTEQTDEVSQTRVRSYVYGMEAISTSSRQPVLGTGSLESRPSNKSNSNGSRSDEWYNRRKSYGFEKVSGEQTNDSSSTLSTKGDDSKLESTDSGICRSSETFNVPSWNRKVQASLWNKAGESDVLSVSHSIQIKPKSTVGEDKDSVDKRKTTVVSFGIKNDLSDKEATNNKVTDVIRRNFSSAKMLSASLVNEVKSEDSDEKGRNRHVTVSVPIVQEDSSPTVGSRRLFYQQLAQGTTLSIEKSSKKPVRGADESPPSLLALRLGGDDWWMKPNRELREFSPESKLGNEDWRVPSKLLSSAMKRHSFAGDNSWKNLNGNENFNEIALQGSTGEDEGWRRAIKYSDTEMKRHSIAVDELKYVQDENPSSMTVAFGHDVDNSILKKHKKVEFCKTEVHFAAEPGRFNIVETDEKPPSTNMFRRRRRPTIPAPEAMKGTNLPEVRFGDSIYEKQLLGGNDDVTAVAILKTPVRPTTLRLSVQEDTFEDTEEQVFTQANATIRPNQEEDEENEDQNNAEFSLDSKPRSILKNFSKPQPYHLGQEDNSPSSLDDDNDEKWGVRLRPVARDQIPAWKSTVMVSSHDAVMPMEYSGQSELQKLLRSLRPANQRKHDMLLAARYSGTTKTSVSDWSVAERVRHVEQVSTETKGFSTRVNFGGGEARVLEEQQPSEGGANQRLFQSNDRPKPIWQRREEAIMASDEFKHLSDKRKALVVQIGHNGTTIRHSSNYETNSPQRIGTTTKITIDLSPSPTSVPDTQYPTREDWETSDINKTKQNEVLHSPSLIMKTIRCSSPNNQARRSSVTSFQEKWRNSSELHSNSFLKGGIRSYVDNNSAWTAEYNSKSNRQTNVRRLAMAIGDRGIADGEGSPATKSLISSNNGNYWGSTKERCCNDEVVVTNRLPKQHSEQNNCRVNREESMSWSESGVSERGSTEEVVVGGQLDAWRALYCDIDSELSDDSEKADEEVRSYMSTEGEGGSSEISGSWSRATALRHCQKREYTTGYTVSEPAHIADEPKLTHSSVATAVLPNYGESSRLRSVETLVSTRSGHPKITSIALRYDGDSTASDACKFTSRTTISPERRHSSYNEGEIKTRVDNVSSTFLEPTYKSQTSLFSPKTESILERNSASFSERHDGYHARSQVYNSKDKLSFSEKLDSENRKELSLARMQPPAKLSIVTSEVPARTFSSAKSAFEKQQFNRRSASPPTSATSYSPSASLHQSPATSTSSSRVLSSYERKQSNSSTSRRSPSPLASDLTQQFSSIFSKRPSSPPVTSEQATETTSTSARRNSHEKLAVTESRHRVKNTTSLANLNSKVITTKVESDIGVLTRTTSRSPNPSSKLTALSKNSLNKDFIGRVRSESPVRQFSERSSNHNTKHISSDKPASLKDITDSPVKSGSQSPIYQNRDVYHSDVTKSSRKSETLSEIKLTECGLEAIETDSAILEELTRAADQILQAVNGYTDEDSRRASSDDDRGKRTKERRILGTIVEAPTRKQSDDKRDSLKMNGNSRRPQRTSSKTKLGPTSSTSSVESISRETRRTPSKTSSRTARMVQRASSRELLLQSHASSSEDIASGTESAKPRVPPPRRARTSSSSSKTVQTSPSKPREKKETTESSRTTKERSSTSRVKSREATVSSQESRRKTPETKQYPVKEKTIPAVNSSVSGRERSSSSRTTTTRTKKSASSRHEGASKTNK